MRAPSATTVRRGAGVQRRCADRVPQVRRAAAQAVRQRGRGVQGQRLLPHRQPRVRQELGQRLREELRVLGELVESEQLVGSSEKSSSTSVQLEFELAARPARRPPPQPPADPRSYPQARRDGTPARAVRLPSVAAWGNLSIRRSLSRLLAVLRPDWSRTVAARRVGRGRARRPGRGRRAALRSARRPAPTSSSRRATCPPASN